MKPITKFIFFIAMAAALAFPGLASAQTGSDEYSLSPDHITSKTAFVLKTLSDRFPCGAVFKNQNVDVDETENIIDLSFQDSSADSGSGPCAGGPVGPAFNIPGLKDGSYEVYVGQMGNCPGSMVCPPPISVPELAGILEVSGRAGINPVLVSAHGSDTRFHLFFSGNGMELSLPKSFDGIRNPARVDILGKDIPAIRR